MSALPDAMWNTDDDLRPSGRRRDESQLHPNFDPRLAAMNKVVKRNKAEMEAVHKSIRKRSQKIDAWCVGDITC